MAFNDNVLSSGKSKEVTPHEYNVFVRCSLAGGLVGLLRGCVVEVLGAVDTFQEEILILDPGWQAEDPGVIGSGECHVSGTGRRPVLSARGCSPCRIPTGYL